MTKTPMKYAAVALLAVATGIYAGPTLAQSAPHRTTNSEMLRAAPQISGEFTGAVFNAGPGTGMGPGSVLTNPFYAYPDSYIGLNRSQQEHTTGN
jgi:hypothetical protein